jgi:hypothetical protein
MRRSIFALIISVAAGCNGTGGGTATTDSNAVELALVGVPNVQLFDATTASSTSSSVASAIVTIKEIDAKVDVGHADKWVAITNAAVTVDLLKLDGTTLNSLGITTLPPGHIEALRLVLDEVGAYVVLKNGSKKPLEVPENGIVEVEGKLDLDSCAAGIVILDFDPHIKTEREHDKSEYELTCRSHIKTEELKGSCNTPPPQCSSTVPCPTGDVCQAGVCVPDPCNGVTCSVVGQFCQNGACVPDPCFGVMCTAPATCSRSDGMCH